MMTFRVVGLRPDGTRLQAAEEQSYDRATQIEKALIESHEFESVTIERGESEPPSWPDPEQATGTARPPLKHV